MHGAIERLEAWRPSPAWSKLRSVAWADDLAASALWFAELLENDAPSGDISGLWFGLFRPVRDDRDVSDFYVSGSRSAPAPDWPCDIDWWSDGRYRCSEALRAAADAEPPDDDELRWVIDYGVSLLHVGSSIVRLLSLVPPSLWLGESSVRHVALGHDSGVSNDVAVIDRTGVHLTASTVS
jgi:hypothetical protein